MAENLAWLCVGLFPICVTLALPVALTAIVGRLAGLAADRRHKGLMWLVSLMGGDIPLSHGIGLRLS